MIGRAVPSSEGGNEAAGDDESRVHCSTLELGQQRLECSLALSSLQRSRPNHELQKLEWKCSWKGLNCFTLGSSDDIRLGRAQ